MHRGPIWASDCSTIESGRSYDLDFIYYSLILQQDAIYLKQAGGAQPHVHPKDIYPLWVGLPSDVIEQEAIAMVLRDVDAEIDALERWLEAAREVKQGMMQELLSGRTRLPVEGVAV